MQTMDELLFTNIDVTSTVTASLLINISENQSFQAALREEIAATQSQESYNIKDYIAKKDTLLHYAVMESIRMCPALCKYRYLCVFIGKTMVVNNKPNRLKQQGSLYLKRQQLTR